MLDIVTFKWRSQAGYRSTFGPETVNTLKRMCARHYHGEHRFTCVTDDPSGIDEDVRIIPLWNDFADLPSPHGGTNPSCYRRLKLFSMEAATLIGPRFVSLDLDCVITGDMAPVWDRPEDFVIWGATNPTTSYNGSMMLMTAGARQQVWTTFDPRNSPRRARAAQCFGSDQGWISYCLGPNEKKWTHADGVYSYRNDIKPKRGVLPKDAKVVFFHGREDPWGHQAQSTTWVREHWR